MLLPLYKEIKDLKAKLHDTKEDLSAESAARIILQSDLKDTRRDLTAESSARIALKSKLEDTRKSLSAECDSRIALKSDLQSLQGVCDGLRSCLDVERADNRKRDDVCAEQHAKIISVRHYHFPAALYPLIPWL